MFEYLDLEEVDVLIHARNFLANNSYQPDLRRRLDGIISKYTRPEQCDHRPPFHGLGVVCEYERNHNGPHMWASSNGPPCRITWDD